MHALIQTDVLQTLNGVHCGLVAHAIFNVIFRFVVISLVGFSGNCTHQWMCLAAIVV